MSESIYILDGHYLTYRAFHAMSNAELHDSQGRPTGAIFGLLRIILAVLDEHDPDYLICAMDSEEPTFRHEFYEEYKAERPEMPDELRAQIPMVRELLETLDVPVAIEPGYECDDLIASMVERWTDRPDAEMTIVSNDKDNFQLVEDRVRILKIKEGFSDIEFLGPAEVEEELGVAPAQVPDYLALVGDKIDNVPGVEGIGPTYASRLLKEFGTIERMLDNRERISEVVSDRLTDSILDNEEQLADSKHLVVLKRDAPLDLELVDAEFKRIPLDDLAEFCRGYDLRSIREGIEERMDRNPGWDELAVDYSRVQLEELAGDEAFFDSDVLYGYVATPDPGCKPMAIDEFYLVISNGEEARIITSTCDANAADPQSFESLMANVSDSTFVTHNQKLLQILCHRFGIELPSEDSNFDLQLVSYLVDPDKDHGLDEIIQRVYEVSVPERPEERADWEEWLVKRARLMERVHGSLAEALRERKQDGVLRELENPLTRILARMEYNGIAIETQRLSTIAGELDDKLSRLRDRSMEILMSLYDHQSVDGLLELFDLVGGEFNLNSPTQLRTILFERLDLPVQDRTGTGKASTAKSTLEALRGEHPFVNLVLQYREEDDDGEGLTRTEREALKCLMDEFELEDSEDLKTLFDLVGGTFTLDSPKQLREILFDKLALPVKGKTDGGDPSTDVDVLEELRGEHPLVDLVLEYRKYNKIDSTYLQPMIDAVNRRTGRLHTEFNQTVAATGRLSSSRPNLQNIPVRDEYGRRVREAFVASRADYELVAADYSQIELRLLAHVSGDERLSKSFREGRDIHSTTAADLFGKDLDEVEEGDRRVAKVVNYGITYGLSAYGLSNDLDISQPEAQEYIDRYFERYPGVKTYIDQTVERAREQGYVETLWGRRRYIEDLAGGNVHQQQFAERAAVNAPIQGTAADLMKKAMIDLDPRLDDFDARLLLQVHDELVLEVHEDQTDHLIETLEPVMTEVIELSVPLTVSVKQGSNWAEVSK